MQPVLYGSLFLAGLAGSVHCLAMCGPLLIAFSKALGGGEGNTLLGRGGLWYHAGRIWTYGLLGFAAGWAGSRFRLTSALLGWQQPFAVGMSVLVVMIGLAAFGWIPGVRLGTSLPNACVETAGRRPWLAALLAQRHWSSRLLLGAIMGLLPCGLVYAMLLLVATMPTPAHAALGMLSFGAGTLPALSILMLGRGAVPGWLRGRSPRFTAGLLVVVGLWMLVRSLHTPPG